MMLILQGGSCNIGNYSAGHKESRNSFSGIEQGCKLHF